MQSVGDILKKFDPVRDKYISREFQKYGYDLAEALGDLAHKALYIKLAKQEPRALLEGAKNFVKDAQNVRSPGRLFMWRLQQLKKEVKVNQTNEKRT